jgi:small subunit ribosomal protein S17
MSENNRGVGRVLSGLVVSDKADKTITIEVVRTIRHKKYNKFIKQRDRYHAHDEGNTANAGDKVEIVESRPTSKSKRWRLRSILEKATT